MFFYILFFYKVQVQVQVGFMCIGVLVETSHKEKCPEFFFSPPPFLQKIPTNKTTHINPTWTWTWTL